MLGGMTPPKIYKAIGIMTGTSLDGIDAVLVETDGLDHIVFKEYVAEPFPVELKASLAQLCTEDIPLQDILRTEQAYTQAVADVVKALPKADIVGFHGQTIRHYPQEGLTWQLGNAQLLAQQTGMRVVSDFRRRDMAAGGEGAPLVPLFHQALLNGSSQPLPTAILNVGGVANVTYFGENGEIFATDTGPGNGLIDMWVNQHTGANYDNNGAIAAQGKVHDALIEQALTTIPFFNRPFPRSADRYDFDTMLSLVEGLSVEDGAATLTAFTSRSVTHAVAHLPRPHTLYVAGGGVHNATLMRQLGQYVNVQPVTALGWRADTLEAECFAWLAVRHLTRQPLSIPATTHCAHATVGGLMTA